MTHLELIASLRAAVEDALRPLLAGCERVALIDFPHYPNVGDSAIYLGQLACLRSLGVPYPSYICDFQTYDREQLRRSVGGGTILLTGGGSFGDVWELGQRCREEIVASFPDNAIIQLPQTIHFERRDALRQAQRIFDGHPKLTLLVRDRRSLEIAGNEFRAPSLLCPDMAFCLGPLESPVSPSQPLVWLARTDKESAGGRIPQAGAEFRADWITEPATLLRRLTDRLITETRRPHTGRFFRPLLSTLYAPLARQRLRRGCRLLSAGEVVITDRLHGHVLSLLLGIPHVLLDNSYGKLFHFYQTWAAGGAEVRWADSPEEALWLAFSLAGPASASRQPASARTQWKELPT